MCNVKIRDIRETMYNQFKSFDVKYDRIYNLIYCYRSLIISCTYIHIHISIYYISNERFFLRYTRLIILPAVNGNAVASIVFFLPIYSISGPPAMPPTSALSGISDPIHMLCNIKFGI